MENASPFYDCAPFFFLLGQAGMKRLSRWLGGLLFAVIALIVATWAFGAVWFDGPFGAGNRMAAALLATTFVVVLLFVRPFWRKLGTVVVLFAGFHDNRSGADNADAEVSALTTSREDRFGASLSTQSRGLSRDTSTFGMGDLFVQPLCSAGRKRTGTQLRGREYSA